MTRQSQTMPRRAIFALCLSLLIAMPLLAGENNSQDAKPGPVTEEKQQPAPTRKSAADVLERAIRQMHAASTRMESGKAGDETWHLQQQTLDDLTRLITLLQNQPPPQAKPPQKQQSQKQQRQPQPRKPRPQDAQQKKSPNKQRQSDDGKSSTERLDKARKDQRKAAAESRGRLFKDIWGHLPEAVREKMRNSFSEEYLPKYAAEVRKYYEELAKRNRSRKGR